LPTHSFLEQAGCWYLNSGIQEPTGGVARYYRVDLAKNASVSTEITGYAVSTFAYLHAISGREEYLDRARRAAAFLTRSAWNDRLRAMPFECGSGTGLTYFFDCGIIVRGLLALYRATAEQEWLDGAELCAEAMRDFRGADGKYHPILSLPEKHPVARDERWSRNPGCYQVKAALGWLELARATGSYEWVAQYEEVLLNSLDEHLSFTSLELQRDRVMDRLHAYCYFLEGLLPYTERPDCRKALAGGINEVAGLLRQIAPEFVRSDVYAQLLRIRLYSDTLGVSSLDRAAAEDEASALEGFQVQSDDIRQRGSFGFGRKTAQMLPFSNPVSTAFGVQALVMWHDYKAGRQSASPQELI
jgi:hypothetical protein